MSLPTLTQAMGYSPSSKKQYELNVKLRELLEAKSYSTNPADYSYDEKSLLMQYTGMGGLHKHGSEARGSGILSEFYTDFEIAEKMWGLAYKHGFLAGKGQHVLEPSFGTGRFFMTLWPGAGTELTGYEVDKYAFTIGAMLFKNLHPDAEANFKEASFESLFVKFGKSDTPEPEFDLVIGNPPYGEYRGGLSTIEKPATKAQQIDQYFLTRSLDVTKKGGLVIMIIPSTFLRNAQKYNELKELIDAKASLAEALRMPVGAFADTQVGTDIVVFKKK